MAVTTTEKFYLDFNTNNIVNINAKQYDTESRFINIVCTDHGKVVKLNPITESVFIRWKKADGKAIFKMGEVLDDGSVLITLTQQMLIASGTQVADILITTYLDNVDVETWEDLEVLIETKNAGIISTMKFNVNVVSAPIDANALISSEELDALSEVIVKYEDRWGDVFEALKLCETYTDKAKTAAENADKAIENINNFLGTIDDDETTDTLYGIKKACEIARDSAKAATEAAEAATAEAKTATQNAKDLIGTEDDESGTNTMYGIMQSAKDATDYAKEVAETYAEELDNRVKKTGDEMSGDLTTPNLNATNSLILGKSTFSYDDNTASVVISFSAPITTEDDEIATESEIVETDETDVADEAVVTDETDTTDENNTIE